MHNAALGPDVVAYPEGMETLVGDRGIGLSSGQVRPSALARILVREAEFLVLGNSSSVLDVEAEHLPWQRVLEQSTTCLAVSHQPAMLERAEQVLLLEDGRVTAHGKPERLLQHSTELRRPGAAAAGGSVQACADG